MEQCDWLASKSAILYTCTQGICIEITKGDSELLQEQRISATLGNVRIHLLVCSFFFSTPIPLQLRTLET